MKIAYLDCFSGISGDMFLGALVDAGVPVSILQDAVSSLKIDVRLDVRRVNRSGIDSAKVDVLTAEGELAEAAHKDSATLAPSAPSQFENGGESAPEHPHLHEHTHGHGNEHSHEHEHADNQEQSGDHKDSHGHAHTHEHEYNHAHGRSLSVIRQIIRNSGLDLAVQDLALKAFDLLGNAEAKIHNVPVETIHFHEVGAADAIADIVATAAGCHWLQVERWHCSALNVGGGHVHCAHGKFPVPAPATLELLRDLPVYSSGVQKELVTPTGAALLRALDVSAGNFPSIRMLSTGYGAGSRDLPGQPNVLRLVVGESAASGSLGHGSHEHDVQHTPDKVGIMETTIDDATPEVLSYVADRLLAAGASDVYRTQVQMKKGRMGTQLTVLCTPARAEELQRILFEESTTLGLRYREEQKFSISRTSVDVETEWGEVRVKLGIRSGKIVNAAPEYEDCRTIAERYSLPLKQVMQAAMAAYQMQEARR